MNFFLILIFLILFIYAIRWLGYEFFYNEKTAPKLGFLNSNQSQNLVEDNWQNFIKTDIFKKIDYILDHHSDYYKRLTMAGKARFVNRLRAFEQTKKFVGMQNLEITAEMRVLISAAAIQITFGLKKFIDPHFEVIMVYPESFYLGSINAHMKGGTSPSGRIFLSWADFVHGYAIEDDKYNLGLHEMAHALKIEAKFIKTRSRAFRKQFQRFLKVGKSEFEKLNRREASFLREYGGTNAHEFFAVCVEHFFEAPEDFKAHLPEIFEELRLLLNQNPINKETDYRLQEAPKANFAKIDASFDQNKTLKNYADSNWHWSLTLMAFGFASLIAFLFLIPKIAIGFPIVLLILIAVVSIGYFAHKDLFFDTKALRKSWFFLYLFLGLGVNFLTLLFIVNDFFADNYKYQEIHIVDNYDFRGEKKDIVVVDFKDQNFEYNYFLRKMSRRNFPAGAPAIECHYIYKKGFFGIKIIKNAYAIEAK